MMFRAVLCGTILLTTALCFAQAVPVPALSNPQPAMASPNAGSPMGPDSQFNRLESSLEGAVRSGDDQPVVNARVEIVNPDNGNSLVSTYTGPLGTFAISGLQRGTYEVVATSGIFDTRERIDVMGPSMTVTLRIPNMKASTGGTRSVGDHNTVSVASLKVPDKARDELEKARKDLNKRQYEEALKHVNNSLAVAPSFAEALTLRGILEMSSNHHGEAQKDLQQAINSDSNYALAYIVMGATLNDQQKFADALRPLTRAIELSPTSWQAHFEMARALLGTGDFQHALAESTQAEQTTSEFAAVHLVRAHALMGCKQYSDAITEYEKYLSKDSTGPEADNAREGLDQARAFAATGSVR